MNPPEFGPIPDWLLDIAEPVLADMQAPTPVDLVLEYREGPESLGIVLVGRRDRSDGSASE